MDDFIHLAMAAATRRSTMPDWQPESEEDRERTGVMIGSGIGGLRPSPTPPSSYEKGAAGVSARSSFRRP